MDDGRVRRRFLGVALCFALVTLSLSTALFADTAEARHRWTAESIGDGYGVADAVPADSGPTGSGVYPHGREPHGPPTTPTEPKPATPTPTETPRETATEASKSPPVTARPNSKAMATAASPVGSTTDTARETTEPDEKPTENADSGGSLSTAGPLAATLTALLLGSALVAIRRRR
ncbi:hypothetical protein [Haloarcula amylovorans]|uniref:hypothetical protein n=1 Tax=Haloarcula amylovorans TaxID=2562280 RepID=UPI001075EDC9|nr:hypothetical protein [Halomicroarcula amylolytica]